MGNLKNTILKMTVLSTFLATSAWAGDKEISLDTGSLLTSSDGWEVIGGTPMTTVGISGGWDIAPGLTAVGGVNWSLSGATNHFGNQWWEDDVDGTSAPGSEGFIAALRVVQLQAGVRSDLMQNRWVRPFGVAKMSANIGSLRLDDDPKDKDNVNQIKASGLSIGGIAAVGVALERPRKTAGPFAVRGELEAGYGFATALKFDEIGKLGMNGMHMRLGFGIRF
jgi:hypothetical protein